MPINIMSCKYYCIDETMIIVIGGSRGSFRDMPPFWTRVGRGPIGN